MEFYDAHFYHRSYRIFSTWFVPFLLLYEAVANGLIESALRLNIIINLGLLCFRANCVMLILRP